MEIGRDCHPFLTFFSKQMLPILHRSSEEGQTCISLINGKCQLKHAPAAKRSDMNKIKNIKNVTRGNDSRSEVEKQGKDNSIKRSVYTSPTYISTY